ncbi:MAG: PEP-CTERM sorting domain-containing protein [Azonexaceae bacterium]|nr:PEP-CTERM sorting domain-containing protein [Azonexaceae bacterium]
MKKTILATAMLSLLAAAPLAQAATSSYNVQTTWYEPDTQPRDSIFIGSFDYDSTTHVVTNLKGILSESMSGDTIAYPNDNMAWLTLNNQLVSWYDASLKGTFAATFKNTTTATFCDSAMCGSPADNWSPQTGVDVGGVYNGFPKVAKNPGNAYALIFVPNDPLTALTQAQLDKVAYADCAPLSGPGGFGGGGMMGAVCMTGTSVAGYGAVGTMSGYPVSQSITAAVPEPESYAMFLAGLGLMGFVARRRKTIP